jgi:hypothetical protein
MVTNDGDVEVMLLEDKVRLGVESRGMMAKGGDIVGRNQPFICEC